MNSEQRDDDHRDDPIYGAGTESESAGGYAEDRQAEHDGGPRDRGSKEPLGPLTPDDDVPLGDTAEAHDEITEHDLPKGHPGRAAVARQAGGGEKTTRGGA